MADRVLFIGWNRAVVGREQQAMQVFQKAAEFYSKLQSEGRIESFELVILGFHGGDLNGFTLIRGSADKLSEVRRDDGFVDLIVEAGYCTEGLGVVDGYIGEGVTKALSRWSKLI